MDSVAEHVTALPGVRAAGFARVLPLGFGGSRMGVIVPGYQPGRDEDMGLNYNVASPAYFDTMGIDLLAGRLFDDRDARESTPVAVVNETMATRYWPAGAALGSRIRFEQQGPDVEVIGIVQDVKYRMLREDPAPSFYLPYTQSTARDGVLHVRTAGDPTAALLTIRQVLMEVDADVPATTSRTLREQAELNAAEERLAMIIALTLASAALLLAAVGLYGSMAYAIGQRTRELGVRLALGATVGDVRRLVLAQGLKLCLAGSALGIVVALAFARTIEHRLFQVTARDPLTLAAAALILCTVALLACWVPARRAMRVDPATALRT
jgi:predicted permease